MVLRAWVSPISHNTILYSTNNNLDVNNAFPLPLATGLSMHNAYRLTWSHASVCLPFSLIPILCSFLLSTACRETVRLNFAWIIYLDWGWRFVRFTWIVQLFRSFVRCSAFSRSACVLQQVAKVNVAMAASKWRQSPFGEQMKQTEQTNQLTDWETPTLRDHRSH